MAAYCANSKIFDEGYPWKLHPKNIYAVLGATAFANFRDLPESSTVDNVVKGLCRKQPADLAGAGVSYSVLDIVNLEQRLSYVADLVGDNGVEANAFAVTCCRTEPLDVFRARHDVLIQHLIDVARQTPVKPRLEFPFKHTQTDQHSPLVGGDYYEWQQGRKYGLENFKQFIQHISA